MRWNGIKNGQLLSLLETYDFEVWIVVDKNILYQQNLSTLPCMGAYQIFTSMCLFM